MLMIRSSNNNTNTNANDDSAKSNEAAGDEARASPCRGRRLVRPTAGHRGAPCGLRPGGEALRSVLILCVFVYSFLCIFLV